MARFLMHPGYGVEKVCRFNTAWINALDNSGEALILKYDDARADEIGAFSTLLDFLGADAGNIEQTVDAASFERMGSRERKGDMDVHWLRTGIPGDPESAKVRRGKMKGYVDYLDAGTVAECKAIAARYGFDA